MAKVQVKITPSLASVLTAQSSGWLTLKKELGEGATMGDLLADLAPAYKNFSNTIFDPGTGEISDQLMIMLNDKLLQSSEVKKVKLGDGDTVTFTLVFTGG